MAESREELWMSAKERDRLKILHEVGLDLRGQTAPVEVLVIDHAEEVTNEE
jgi:hypothetical protein